MFCLFKFSLFHIIIFFYKISVIVIIIIIIIIIIILSFFFSNGFGCLFIHDSNRSYNV